jgi:hypothetical protein
MTTKKLIEVLRSVLLKVQRSKSLNDFIKAKDVALLEVVVVVVAIMEAVAKLFRTLAELISTLSLEL